MRRKQNCGYVNLNLGNAGVILTEQGGGYGETKILRSYRLGQNNGFLRAESVSCVDVIKLYTIVRNRKYEAVSFN